MSQKQLFEAFSEEQQAEYEKEAMQMYDPAIVKASNRNGKAILQPRNSASRTKATPCTRVCWKRCPRGRLTGSPGGVEAWRKHMDYFWTPNDEQLLGLANGYNDDPRFKANFDKIDPGLAAFVREAVEVYVRNRRK